MIDKIGKALDPYRWIAAGVAFAALLSAVYWVYDWAWDRGYTKHKVETDAAAQAQRETNQLFARTNDVVAAKQGKALDRGRSVTSRKAEDELQKTLAALRANEPKCLPNADSSSGVPGVSDAGRSADACAAVAGVAVRNYQVATNNADQVTAIQAHVERSRKGYNEATKQKDERPVSDAEARWTAREKEFDQRAKALEGKK